MIVERKPLSMVEVKELLESLKEENVKKDLTGYLKFSKIKKEDALKLKKEIEDLNMIKIKEAHIVKIIDILPEDSSDLNKIFTDVSLDESEINKLLEVVKKYA
jgi:DNA-directed RNA polymerase subunit F